MTDKYEDIIHLPHHVSKKYPQMPVSDRAAQFIPFMALTGYEDAVEETARLTDRKIDWTKHKRIYWMIFFGVHRNPAKRWRCCTFSRTKEKQAALIV